MSSARQLGPQPVVQLEQRFDDEMRQIVYDVDRNWPRIRAVDKQGSVGAPGWISLAEYDIHHHTFPDCITRARTNHIG